ncbi:transposase [Pandoraea anhela]|uniref:Uncharacterized protein n=1 Tax=Pandoraea anhela TaxID=2508295 RepID=A0A5E4S7V1_9BURK|nr:transposase [Pandoraea anhela]VVD71660.1 hypothetical protein PAN31108_00630 [Pandoraea anhela]
MQSRGDECGAPLQRHVPVPALSLGKIVADIPPIVQALGKAKCKTPDELLASRARFGNPTYAVEDSDDGVTWYFSNDLQEAVALGLKWVERGCALEQIPEDQHGEVVYSYAVCGVEADCDIEYLLYSHRLWQAAGADLNEAATPEIMTRLRMEFFKFVARWRTQFTLLDFTHPASVTAYLEDWESDLQP